MKRSTSRKNRREANQVTRIPSPSHFPLSWGPPGNFFRHASPAHSEQESGLGYDFPIRENITFTPRLGISWHRQNLGQTNGRGVIDEEGFTGPFSGLDSTYDARWLSLNFGFDASLSLGERSRLRLTARYVTGQFEAEADWNLREDFLGFTHEANARGLRLGIGYDWDFAPDWTLGTYVDWWNFETVG
jgi:hypothetical protein